MVNVLSSDSSTSKADDDYLRSDEINAPSYSKLSSVRRQCLVHQANKSILLLIYFTSKSF